MPIDWKDPAVKDRLLASIIASFEGKINCTKVAQLFGEGATYNAIENFLRSPKKEALKLKAEVGDEPGPLPSPAKRAPKTPKKDKNGVMSGRVTKSKKPTNNSSPIKRENLFDDTVSNMSSGDPDGTMDDGEFA